MIAVVAGFGGYFAYQSAQPAFTPKAPIVTQTAKLSPETTPTPTETPTVTQGRTRRVPEDYPTIYEAIMAASKGDIIQVGPGTYPRFTINKPLTLKGSGAEVTIIDGLIQIMTRGASLTGFTVKGGGEANSDAGVIIGPDGGNEVSDNTIESSDDGVHIHSGDNKVSNNTIKVAGSGVANHAETGGRNNNKIVGNSIEAGENGVIINVGDNNEVWRNTIRFSAVGILISTFYKGQAFISIGNTIYENNLIDNKVQAEDNGSDNIWQENGKGNYWSDWTSPDDDKDGIVDKPYLIAGTAKGVDKYPLASPFQV